MTSIEGEMRYLKKVTNFQKISFWPVFLCKEVKG